MRFLISFSVIERLKDLRVKFLIGSPKISGLRKPYWTTTEPEKEK